MKWTNIFKLYNVRKIKKDKIMYLFLCVAIILSVSISLSIPQIVKITEEISFDNIFEVNGNEIKIQTNYISNDLEQRLSDYESKGLLSYYKSYGGNFKVGKNEIFGSIIHGDFGIKDDEIILSKVIANELGKEINDVVTVNANEYKLIEIEEYNKGVDSQAELIGYCKVSKFEIGDQIPYVYIVLTSEEINDDIIEWFNAEGINYDRMTLSDQEERIEGYTNLNAGVLNILNIMSWLLSIILLVSSVVVIITQRMREISILKCLSIRNSSIFKSLFAELTILIIPSVCIGGLLSLLNTNIYFVVYNISVNVDINRFGIIASGIVMYSIIILCIIMISLRVIKRIDPLSVIKRKDSKIKLIGFNEVLLCIITIIMMIVMYSNYLGESMTLITGILMLILFCIVFIIVWISLGSIILFRGRKIERIYKINSLLLNKTMHTIIIVSLIMANLFLLIGFDLENSVKMNYEEKIDKKLGYNHLITGEDSNQINDDLVQIVGQENVTVLKRKSAIVKLEGDKKVINICSIDESDYKVKFNILEGVDLYTGSTLDNEVIISQVFSHENELDVGDELTCYIENDFEEMIIVGIYESGNINNNFIITTQYISNDMKELFLVDIQKSEKVNELEGIKYMSIASIGTALMKKVNDFLIVFKWMCIICSMTIFIYIYLLNNMLFLNQKKDNQVLIALGFKKNRLKGKFIFYSLVQSLYGILGATILYYFVLVVGMSSVFTASVSFSILWIIKSLPMYVLTVLLIYLIFSTKLHRMNEIDELRELV